MNPFLGPRPYSAADNLLFFGRQLASRRLVERIDLRPLTILTSPSGIGKTSILRASVLPALEACGLSTVYFRPDPRSEDGREIDAATSLLNGGLADALGRALLPDRDFEAEAVAKVLRVGPQLTFEAARQWFQALPAADECRTSLLTCPNDSIDRLPMLSRYLRGTMAFEAMSRQLSIFGVRGAGSLKPDRPVSDLQALLQDPGLPRKLRLARADVQAAVRPFDKWGESELVPPHDDVLGPLAHLCGIPARDQALLVRSDGRTGRSVRIVLILDQFEQLFTLSQPDTRARAMRVLAELLVVGAPVHLVISLRKEWYADLTRELAQHLQTLEPAERTTFYLEPMTSAEAGEVMEQAPAAVGSEAISPTQQTALWSGLQVDDTIDAVVLSIACHELFNRRRPGGTGLESAELESLFRSYLTSAVAQISDPTEHAEACDILGEIAGSGATRGFVTETRLLNAPLRDRKRRRKVLGELQRVFLIKADSPRRNMDRVYDIMHERLLAPIRQLIEEKPAIAQFREAAERANQQEAVERGIDVHHCRSLLAEYSRVDWDSRVAGVLLGSLLRELTSEVRGELFQRKGIFGDLVPANMEPRVWLHGRLRELAEVCAQPPPVEDGPTIADRAKLRWWMTAAEIAQVAGSDSDDATDALSLRSALQGPMGWMGAQAVRIARRLHNRSNPAG